MDEPLINQWDMVEDIVERALAQDVASGDVTTEAIIPAGLEARAHILVKEDGVLAGMVAAEAVFRHVDPDLQLEVLKQDGARVKTGDIVARMEGKVANIVKAERTTLNFLCHLSGIATETARYVDAVKGLEAQITDTRKTTPGMRLLEKYAVRVGGGKSHRAHLGDGILIKDNHLAALGSFGVGLKQAVEQASQRSTLNVEVEVATVDEAREALEAGADIIMLDNMSVADMKKVVQFAKGRALLEASGGITLNTVREVAEAGVDLISVGAITISAKALDMSLELEGKG
jgi:nicotinate-nucleotide pyrophosphorylase (carboxylating)